MFTALSPKKVAQGEPCLTTTHDHRLDSSRHKFLRTMIAHAGKPNRSSLIANTMSIRVTYSSAASPRNGRFRRCAEAHAEISCFRFCPFAAIAAWTGQRRGRVDMCAGAVKLPEWPAADTPKSAFLRASWVGVSRNHDGPLLRFLPAPASAPRDLRGFQRAR